MLRHPAPVLRLPSALTQTILCLGCALAVWTFTATAAELTSEETSQLLSRLQETRAKFPTLVADFTEEKTSRLLEKPLSNEGSLTFQLPNRFRRELRGSNPSLMVSNGKNLWIYYPNFKEAELYQLGQRTFLDQAVEALTAGLNFQNVAEYYKYTAVKEGREYKLTLLPRTAGLRKILREISIWVDSEYKIQKTVALLPKGDQITTSYRNQKTGSASPASFDYAPPADAHLSTPLGK